jgi:hypothetical protein
MALFSALLAASATAFIFLSWSEGRRAVAVEHRTGPAIALDDLVGGNHPLAPRTIRQTRLD